VPPQRTAHFPQLGDGALRQHGNAGPPIFGADDPRVAATIDHAPCTAAVSSGTIQWLGEPRFIPTSAYTTMARCAAAAQQVVEDFFWYLLTHRRARFEGIFPSVCTGDTIPPTGVNYALMLRQAVDERGDDDRWAVPTGGWPRDSRSRFAVLRRTSANST
jgi:hypothetical protein